MKKESKALIAALKAAGYTVEDGTDKGATFRHTNGKLVHVRNDIEFMYSTEEIMKYHLDAITEAN